MIRIDPDALYTRTDLAGLLESAGIDVDTFIARLRPRKVFRLVWLGSDLLEALRKAAPLEGRAAKEPMPTATPKSKPRRTKPKKSGGCECISLDEIL